MEMHDEREAKQSRQSWKCFLKRHPEPIDYVCGGPKLWWLLHNAVTFKPLYPLALLLASEGKILQPIPHFAPLETYGKLIHGDGFEMPKKKRKTLDFQFGSESGLQTSRQKTKDLLC